jgi:hypothetical protein
LFVAEVLGQGLLIIPKKYRICCASVIVQVCAADLVVVAGP